MQRWGRRRSLCLKKEPFCGVRLFVAFCLTYFCVSHLSKWPSDLKINGTQENVTFGPAFHGLPCGVLLFDASVGFKNHKI